MADRRRRSHRELNRTQSQRAHAHGAGKAGAAAWLLAVLAGTPVALAQFDLGGTKAPDPQALAKTQGQAQGQAQGQPMRDPLAGKGLDKNNQVEVNEHLIVELHVKDEDLANVLQMLSIQSQINIIASKNVSATVSADLYGATFFEALDAILHVNGYGYVEKGNFIYVYTADELQAIQDANRKVMNKTITLDYLNAVDAAEFAKPLLSDKGVITTNGKTDVFSLPDNAPAGGDNYALGAIMMVNDYEENVEQIEAMIKSIDTRPAQVLVEATVLETKLTEDNAFGIDFTVLGSLDMEDFVGIGGPLKAIEGLFGGKTSDLVGAPVAVPPREGEGGALVSTVGQSQGPGGLKVGVVAGDVAAFMRVLDEVSDTQVISKPNILTLNRQPARVLVGLKVGYLSSTSTDTSTTQTVEFLDTGTQLYFRPFVSRDGMIRMELKPQVSTATIRDVTDSGGATVTIPDENTSELATNVLVRDGNTIVLGGLFRESTNAERRQVPFLGDLPVVGAAFRGNNDSTDRSEIIFMIKPTIVNDQLLSEQGERGDAYVNHTRAGAREGLLFWSRERQSARLLVEADRKERAGDTDGALYCVERSLGLNHAQPEAIAMRERLSSKKRTHPTRSKLDIIIKNESDKALVPAQKPAGEAPEAFSFSLSDDHQPAFATGALTAEPVEQAAASEADVFVEPIPVSDPEQDRAFAQSQLEQALVEQELDMAKAELERVNDELALSRERLAATRTEPRSMPPGQDGRNASITKSSPTATGTTSSVPPAVNPAPLKEESQFETFESLGLVESQELPWLLEDASNGTVVSVPAGDESSMFDPRPTWVMPSEFDSDRVDTLIDQIATDTFWHRSTSENYGFSGSGERGAPIDG